MLGLAQTAASFPLLWLGSQALHWCVHFGRSSLKHQRHPFDLLQPLERWQHQYPTNSISIHPSIHPCTHQCLYHQHHLLRNPSCNYATGVGEFTLATYVLLWVDFNCKQNERCHNKSKTCIFHEYHCGWQIVMFDNLLRKDSYLHKNCPQPLLHQLLFNHMTTNIGIHLRNKVQVIIIFNFFMATNNKVASK